MHYKLKTPTDLASQKSIQCATDRNAWIQEGFFRGSEPQTDSVSVTAWLLLRACHSVWETTQQFVNISPVILTCVKVILSVLPQPHWTQAGRTKKSNAARCLSPKDVSQSMIRFIQLPNEKDFRREGGRSYSSVWRPCIPRVPVMRCGKAQAQLHALFRHSSAPAPAAMTLTKQSPLSLKLEIWLHSQRYEHLWEKRNCLPLPGTDSPFIGRPV